MPTDIDISIQVQSTPVEVQLNYASIPPLTVELSAPPAPALELSFAEIGPKGDKGDQGDPGPQGIQGPKGDKGDQGDSAAASYQHIQGIASSVWTINHNLGFYPNVTVVDSSKREVIGEVEYTSINTIQITFSGGFSGEAYVS